MERVPPAPARLRLAACRVGRRRLERRERFLILLQGRRITAQHLVKTGSQPTGGSVALRGL